MAVALKVLLLAVSVVGTQSETCSSPLTSTVRFSVDSRHNATGHHIIQADLMGADSNETSLDVEAVTASCGASETGRLSAVASTLRDRPGKQQGKPLPPGYEAVPGLGAYKVVTYKKLWIDAETSCNSDGGHLIVVNSQAEADLVPKLCSSTSCHDWVWAGFHDQFQEGHYVTVTGALLSQSGYMVWYSGEPHGVGNNCGVVYKAGSLGDWVCTLTTNFICELDV